MTETKIITDVAESLGVAPDTLTPDTNLADAGLDSLRLWISKTYSPGRR